MRVQIRKFTIAGLGLAALFGLSAGGASAAPQALALVATNGEVQLNCEAGHCSAEFSTFCLQPNRLSPIRGTAYELADAGNVTVTATTRDGRSLSLPASEVLSFTSARNHVAMRIAVLPDQIEQLGLTSVSITVGKDVTVVPTPRAGDGDPIGEAEFAIAAGPLRALGSKIVDNNRERMAAARLTSKLINTLPSADDRRAGAARELWNRTVTAAQTNALYTVGEKIAKRAVDLCDFAVKRKMYGSLRRCLQSEHDVLVNIMNQDYWKAVKTGS